LVKLTRGNVYSDLKYVASLINKHPTLFKKHNVTFEDLLWATSTVVTRSFTIPNAQNEELSYIGIVPFADMFNHDYKLKTPGWEYNNAKGSFQINTVKKYNPGDQVFISYGNKTNLDLLLWRGVMADVDNSQYFFHLVPKGGNHDDVRYKLLQQLDPSSFVITTTTIAPELYAVARILSISEEKLQNPGVQAAIIRTKTMGDDLELEAIKKIVYLCKNALKNTTAIQEDKKLLQNMKLSPRIRNIITLRMHEKMIIQSALERLQDHTQEIRMQQETRKRMSQMYGAFE